MAQARIRQNEAGYYFHVEYGLPGITLVAGKTVDVPGDLVDYIKSIDTLEVIGEPATGSGTAQSPEAPVSRKRGRPKKDSGVTTLQSMAEADEAKPSGELNVEQEQELVDTIIDGQEDPSTGN